MNMIRRVERLEAALIGTDEDVGYKLILLKEGESCEEILARSGLLDWPSERIIAIRFVKSNSKLL
jgi:hypothetical protein